MPDEIPVLKPPITAPPAVPPPAGYEKTGFHTAIDISPEKIVDVVQKMKAAGFFLETLSPVEHPDHFQISYLFNRWEKPDRQLYRVHLPPGSFTCPSVTAHLGGADWQEREAFEMFGLHFDGHPNLKHLLLPEGTDFFPLRKGFKFEGDSLEGLKKQEAVQDALHAKEDREALGKNVKDYFINMGPQHPSTHGVLRLLLHMDGERVLNVEPVVGYAHRADERIGMNNNWQQFYPYPARVDYLGGMIYNWGYVGTVEKALGIEVPERAQYIRIAVCELNRIASHLLWLGTFLLDLGSFTPFLLSMDDREKILDIIERVSGERITYVYFRFGGLARDVDDEFVEGSKKFVKEFRKKLKDYETLITKNVIFKNRTQGVGIITREIANEYGLTGPNLRSTGISYDMRKAEPYGIYSQFQFDIPTDTAGDSFGRYLVRMREMEQSLRILEQVLNQFPKGGEYISPKAPSRNIKVPRGEYYFAVEGARGQFGTHAVSDGGEIPQRLKLNTPSFHTMSSFASFTGGHNYQTSDIVAILGSLDIVVPDMDR
jgi:NADH-quinone oxidoreductase subunit D